MKNEVRGVANAKASSAITAILTSRHASMIFEMAGKFLEN